MKVWMAPKGLHIEPGQTGDEDMLAKIHAQGFFKGWSLDDFERYIKTKNTPIYIACNAKRKIAGFGILRLEQDESELLTLVVAKKFQGIRLGHALMQAMMADLLLSPVTKMFLEVDEDNIAALKLYAHFGFQKVGERQGYYVRPNGKKATALVMRADLD